MKCDCESCLMGLTDCRPKVVIPECACEVCKSGAAIPLQEWRQLSPVHQQIFDELNAAVERGDAYVQGEPCENSSSLV